MGIFSDLRSKLGGSPSVKQEGFSESEYVAIAAQVWASRNLNVSTFRNGDPIPEARTPEEWIEAGKTKQPAWCYYNNDSELGETYGRLYNWFAVTDKRGLVPKGWHVPTRDTRGKPENREFDQLLSHLGGEDYAGSKLKDAGTTHWSSPNKNPADNKSGFTALPGGAREASGAFWGIGGRGFWWTASAYGKDAYILGLEHGSGGADLQYIDQTSGLSVRCLRD